MALRRCRENPEYFQYFVDLVLEYFRDEIL